MDKGGRTPKTYMSSIRLNLKPTRSFSAEKPPKENGPDHSKRMPLVKSKHGISPSTDDKQAPIKPLEAPRFKEPLQDREASEGSNVMLQCVITGSQPLNISWLYNGKMVQSRQTSFTDGLASLVVRECSPEDAGIYTCVSENTAGKQSSSSKLHVIGRNEVPRRPPMEFTNKEVKLEGMQHPPASEVSSRREEKKIERIVEFLDSPEQAEVRVGAQAKLHCVFRSSSVPVACCWIHNREKVVVGGPRVHVHSSETESSVRISQACSDDAGSYTVVVRNQRGTAQHTISLSVIDHPDPPASQPVISQLSAQSVVLSWTGPSYDGGSAVLGYIVEIKPEGLDKPGIWTELTTRCKNTSYRVRSGLEALREYRFRVRAYNAAGVSEPGKESDCVKMASATEGKKEPMEFITVTVDTTHKVGDYYNVHEKLGVGKFGQVFRLSHKETGQSFAGKFYRGRSSKERLAAQKEIEIMNCLHHPKLVQCLAAYDMYPELVMVMEYIAGGELFERIVDDHFEHTEPTSARYMQQILEGMGYVHKQNIIHLDLKPENIVCVDTTGTRIKIIDFGLASKLERGKSLMVMHGTPEFVAPEVISFEPVGLETDMWSIGVICFILLSGECPFQGNNDAETLALVTAAHYEFDEESFEDISDQAKEFISSLISKDRRHRLSCEEALAHPWMVSFTPLSRSPSKSLNKVKMRHFLAKRKWKKTGKAVLALQRMANLSNRPESPGSLSDESWWSEEAEEAIQALDKLLQVEPRFLQPLRDITLPKGATARLTCHVNGYPPPDVEWLQNGQLVIESSRVTLEFDDGVCSLVLSDLKPSDSAVYKCRASNVLGRATCSAKLTVDM